MGRILWHQESLGWPEPRNDSRTSVCEYRFKTPRLKNTFDSSRTNHAASRHRRIVRKILRSVSTPFVATVIGVTTWVSTSSFASMTGFDGLRFLWWRQDRKCRLRRLCHAKPSSRPWRAKATPLEVLAGGRIHFADTQCERKYRVFRTGWKILLSKLEETRYLPGPSKRQFHHRACSHAVISTFYLSFLLRRRRI